MVIADTDHFAPGAGDAIWAWKAFLRGQNPILMDFGIIDVVNPLDPSLGVPSFDSYEAARYAMGDTLRYAERVGLAGMEPRGDLTSTAYALAIPGREYLVLQPAGDGTPDGTPFTVRLEPGTYAVEWYGVERRETREAAPLTVGAAGPVDVTAPAGVTGPVVLYLSAT